MKPVIIIAIAFVLLIPLTVFAQSENQTNNEVPKNYVVNLTDTITITDNIIPEANNPTFLIQQDIERANLNSTIFGIAGITASAISGVIGFYLGTRLSEKTRQHMSKLSHDIIQKNITAINSLLRITGDSHLGEVRLRPDGTVIAHHERGMNEHVAAGDSLSVRKTFSAGVSVGTPDQVKKDKDDKKKDKDND